MTNWVMLDVYIISKFTYCKKRKNIFSLIFLKIPLFSILYNHRDPLKCYECRLKLSLLLYNVDKNLSGFSFLNILLDQYNELYMLAASSNY